MIVLLRLVCTPLTLAIWGFFLEKAYFKPLEKCLFLPKLPYFNGSLKTKQTISKLDNKR